MPVTAILTAGISKFELHKGHWAGDMQRRTGYFHSHHHGV